MKHIKTLIAVGTAILLVGAQAEAASGDARLTGTYAMTGSGACLNAPPYGYAGNFTFNPAFSYSGSAGFSGTFTFNGRGHGQMDLKEVGITPPPVPIGLTPGAAQVNITGPFKYSVANGQVTVRAPNLQEQETLGPDKGATGQIDVIQLAGLVAADNKSLTLASAQPVLMTTTYPNGAVIYSICWYSFVFLK